MNNELIKKYLQADGVVDQIMAGPWSVQLNVMALDWQKAKDPAAAIQAEQDEIDAKIADLQDQKVQKQAELETVMQAVKIDTKPVKEIINEEIINP